MEGDYIKVTRNLLKWEWFHKPNMVHLWVYLLLSANYKKSKWQGIDIERGQVVTGLHSLNIHTGITVQSLRTCLERLKSTGEITIKSTSKYSIITICKYDSYQNIKNKSTVISTVTTTINQQTTNNQSTTSEEIKKERSKEEILLEPFEELLEKWCIYRKQIKKPIVESSKPSVLNKIKKLSGGDIEKAKLIVEQSLENGWVGLFDLINNTTQGTKTSPVANAGAYKDFTQNG